MDHDTAGNPPQTKPSASTERSNWLQVHVLIPLEDNYRKQLSARQIEFWCSELAGWTNEDLLQTVRFILRDCEFFPTLADFYRLKPKAPDPDYPGQPVKLEDIPTRPGSWGEFVIATCSRFLKTHNTPGMYRALIAEMERRGMPEHEFHHGHDVGIAGMRQALSGAQA